MKHIFEISIIFTTLLFGSSLISIGNYKELNPNGCGFSRLSFVEPKFCKFQWHKQMFPLLEKPGKKYSVAEAPWMASLQLFEKENGKHLRNCSGSLIANQWIITAAQCVIGAKFVQIDLGESFTSKNPRFGFYSNAIEIHIHPNYETDQSRNLAIIQIVVADVAIATGINNICLPEMWTNASVSNKPIHEYVNTAGWDKASSFLKIAYWILLNPHETKKAKSNALLKKIDGTNACKSLPGTPIWQYQMGRAVIVAILNSHCSENSKDTLIGSWVDTEIDWVNSVINPITNKSYYNILKFVNTETCPSIHWPKWDPEIMPYYKDLTSKAIHCGKPKEVSIVRSDYTGLLVKNPLNKTIKCFAKPIERWSDSVIGYGKSELELNINKINHFGYLTFSTRCEGENFEKFINLVPGVNQPNNPNSTNVLILGIDSISFLNFERHLPLTKEFLRKQNFYTMYGYNKVGLNKFPNLTPLLTGHYAEDNWRNLGDLENKRFDFNFWPFIWKSYRKRGYLTYYMEDAPEINTFNYFESEINYNNGFEYEPVDYYFRPFFLAIKEKLKGNCYLDEPVVKVMNDYLYDFIKAMNERKNKFWALHWISRLAHDHLNEAGLADYYVSELLNRLFNEKLIDNTVVIFLSDHGVLEAENRHTFSNKFESRKPFCHMWVPKKWRNQNLTVNQHRLTTPFDVHATMRHIIDGEPRNSKYFPYKGNSLFWEIPEDRSCKSIPIAEHWCLCQESIPNNQSMAAKISEFVINNLNDNLSQEPQKCFKLILSKVISVNELRMKDKVIKFEECGETTEICTDEKLVKYSDSPIEAPNKHFAITFEVKPSNALFEATVNYNTKSGQMFIIGIKRMDSKGSQSQCILNPNLKEYCICK